MSRNEGNYYRKTAFEPQGGRRAGYAMTHDCYDEESMSGYHGDWYHNGCDLPCDYLTKEQKLALNGECIVVQKGRT